MRTSLSFRLGCFFLIMFLGFSFSTNGQSKTIVTKALSELAEQGNYLPADLADWDISDQYLDRLSGLTHLYIQQKHAGIPIRNALSVMVLKGNENVYFRPGAVRNIANKVNARFASLSPEQALQMVTSYLGEDEFSVMDLSKEQLETNSFIFETPDFASSPIHARLVYQPIGNELRLAWDVSIEMKFQAHWWNIRVDALNGDILDQNDYTVHCSFEDESLHQHASQIPEAWPDPAPPIGATPGYRVYPYPVEAPSFGNRALLSDPSNSMASPYGWHDINGIAGEEYSITRGNNVFAYEDANNDNAPGYSPDGGTNMLFDHPINTSNPPISNQDAAITNLFYANNAIHDLLYLFGFDEASGNFQINNYGHPGFQNDAVKAEGLDGGGVNNANFSTPPDGSAGRMQMYVWSGNASSCSNLTIISNGLNGPLAVGTASFSPVASVTAQVILINDGLGSFTDGCTPAQNNISNKIALIDRGSCAFIDKVLFAQSSGALGVIIANNATGLPPTMTGTGSVTIPTVSISESDGNLLKAELLAGAVNATINTCTVQPIDANFDNGVIAHEYGHGLSNRLTGGPSSASCLNNTEQGGEGWSDWLGMMMSIEPGDQGSDARGIGTYVKGQSVNGPGIRRFPYSTNMSINPQTYASLAGSSTPHQIGEIWCDAIWDMSWKLMDSFGRSNNPLDTAAGNNIAMRLVLEGMKLQPCNPGFLDARDAILVADALLYNNAHRCLLWEAFAGRGMGYNAQQGSSFSVGDETAGFAMPPFCMPPVAAPVAAFSSDSTTISCARTLQFTDQSQHAFTWFWDFGDQTTSNLQHPQHTFTSPGIYAVKLKVTNPLGQDSITHTIQVVPTFSFALNVTPTSICGGSNVSLNATATGSNNLSYQLNSIPYAPISGTGTALSLNDDQMSGVLPVGFNFNFFGQTYTNFYLCSNGFITFSSGMPANVVYGDPIPLASNPNNLIALAWNDLNPLNAGSAINYFTTGTAPNRKLVVNYQTSHYLSPSSPFVVQAILYEGTNVIEIHTTTISDVSSFDNDATTTQGVENFNGTKAVPVPGRNSSLFAASNDAFRFVPYVPYQYNWQPGGLTGAAATSQPIVNTVYTVTVSDGSGCSITSSSAMVQVNPCPVNLNLRFFLEGYYLGSSSMQPVLFNEGVSTNQLICDSVWVELRQATSPYSIIHSFQAIQNTNGWILANVTCLPGPYYIVVRHRNTIPTWSSTPVLFTGTQVNYDFSDASTKAYGANQREVSSGVWAFYCGDVNQDENTDLLDLQLIELDVTGFQFGYFATDINGDGNVDLLDTVLPELNISQFVFSVHP